MTFTLRPDKYSSLLVQYQPKRITNDIENDSALAQLFNVDVSLFID
ncbi:MAG: hypothetical protein IGQ45_05465 [Cyanobacterium sp. T60_A2020_053]|nr:hypothetical protein [Cyanobacterium sp. T60_A2020_053]